MRAIQVKQHGGPEVLALAELPLPEPGPGEVRLKLGAIGVNFVDVYHRLGRYPGHLPYIPGTEGAGVVDAVGSTVTGVERGAPMVYVRGPGSYAEYACVPAEQLIPLPPGITVDLAAAVMLQGLTAHYLCHDVFPVKAGDAVLIHAAAGGTGLLLTQMCTALGAIVLGTASTDAKAKLALDAGAMEVIRYDRESVADEVHRFTRTLRGGPGVAVVFDGVGHATFDSSLACLRPRGLLALFGGASGPVPPFDPMQLSAKGSLVLTRPTLGDFIPDREALLARAGAVLGMVASGRLRVRAEHRLPLEKAEHAHRDLEARATTGKTLLLP